MSTGRVESLRWSVRLFVGVSVVVATGGCSGDSSVVNPKGPAASSVAGLWWAMLATATATATVVFAFVAGMLLLAAARGRRKTEDQAKAAAPWGEPFIVIAGVVVSAAILVGFFLFSLGRMQPLADGGRRTKLTVSVIGHDWWWEVRYPNGAVSANEIHIPTGVAVRLELTTDDVIHSFWVPRLGPKADMIPGQRNSLWLEASEPGVYRGQCAEFCGLQHANMIIRVVADSPSGFERWVGEQAQPAAPSELPARRSGTGLAEVSLARTIEHRGSREIHTAAPRPPTGAVSASSALTTNNTTVRYLIRTLPGLPVPGLPVPLELLQRRTAMGRRRR